MIIVSQDKDVITILNNIIGLQTKECIANSDGEKEYGIEAITEERMCMLGFYETEETARAVLQEIINTFGIKGIENVSYEYADLAIKMRSYAIYEMPKE